MILDLGAERARAFLRTGLIAALVASWGVYSRHVPLKSGSKALKAALMKKVPPEPGSAAVSWVNGGAPLDAAALASIQKEDKAVAPDGMSYAAILRRAQEISAQVNAKSRDMGLSPDDRRPGDDDPAVVVPMMIGYLASPSAEQRAQAAMTLCDNRFAKWERAGEAVPGLEEVVSSKDPEGAEFAALALKRIRFWQTQRRSSASKP